MRTLLLAVFSILLCACAPRELPDQARAVESVHYEKAGRGYLEVRDIGDKMTCAILYDGNRKAPVGVSCVTQ